MKLEANWATYLFLAEIYSLSWLPADAPLTLFSDLKDRFEAWYSPSSVVIMWRSHEEITSGSITGNPSISGCIKRRFYDR